MSFNNQNPSQRVNKQERRLIVLCLVVAGLMLVSVLRRIFFS
jgi:hypothetical protein